MVGWWWLLWLISLLLPQICYVTNPEPVSIRTANTMPWVETAGAVVVLVCFLLWVQIVRSITSDQVATAAGFGEPVP